MALAKENRLVSKRDFELVLREGVAVKGRSLFIKYRKNSLRLARFGFIVSLKVAGNTATRNRIKRVFSEMARKFIEEGSKGFDVAIVVNKKDKEELLIQEVKDLLGKLTQ